MKPTNIGSATPLTDAESSDGTTVTGGTDWGTGTVGDTSPSAKDQWKQPVRVASTATLTVSTGLNAGDTVDGVTLVAGDRVLLKDQSTASQNGIYVAGTTPERAADMDDDGEVMGALVYVIAGTTNGGKAYKNTNTSIPTVGSTSLTFTEFGAGGSVTYATPAIVLGTAAAAGAATTVIRSDSTIAAFDATVPVTQAFSDTAATGSAAFAARRDHKHGMPASPGGGSFTHTYFGYNTIGGSTESVTNMRQYMKKITLSSAGVLNSIGVYVKQTTAGNVISISAAVLTDNSGSPELLIAKNTADGGDALFLSTANGSAGAARWIDLAMGVYLAAGDYWIAVQLGSNSSPAGHQVYFDGSGTDRYYTNSTSSTRMSDSGWTAVTTSTNKYSIRASVLT